MNKIAAWFGCLWIGLLGVATAGESNEFQAIIEGEPCVVRAYQDEPGIPLPTWFEAKPQPLPPPWQLAILIGSSNVTTFLSNDEIRALWATSAASNDEIHKLRMAVANQYEITRESAADNPWKGMTQRLTTAWTIESARGKFILYEVSVQLVKEPNPMQLYGALKWHEGAWKIGKIGFEVRDLKASINDEFAKLKAEGKVQAAPLDSLR